MPVTEAQVIEALRPVEDPELHRSIVDLGMVRQIDDRRRPRSPCSVALTIAGCPLRAEITNRVTGAVAALDGVDDGRPRLHGDDRRGAGRAAPAAPRRPGGHRGQPAGPRPRRGPGHPVRRPRLQDPRAADRVGQGRRRQVVGHDQPVGGARPAGPRRGRRRRRRVGLLDPADARRRAPAGRHRRDARAARGRTACAASRWASSPHEDQPVIWRGPMLHKALEQFLTDVFWDEPDYLVVDLPPGTGDISLVARRSSCPGPRCTS